MDIAHITLPQWLSTGIALLVLSLAWRAIGVVLDEFIRRMFPKRRLGNRNSDDAFPVGNYKDNWVDRLIGAMNQNAEVNAKTASILENVIAKQEVVIESLKLVQIEISENNTLANESRRDSREVLNQVHTIRQKMEGAGA